MSIPTLRNAAGWLTGLSLGYLAIVAVAAGPAPKHKELPAGAARPPRELKAKFHLDFRTTDYDPEALLPVGQAEMSRDEKGLLIRFPPAS
jgi:hypothetical protein